MTLYHDEVEFSGLMAYIAVVPFWDLRDYLLG